MGNLGLSTIRKEGWKKGNVKILLLDYCQVQQHPLRTMARRPGPCQLPGAEIQSKRRTRGLPFSKGHLSANARFWANNSQIPAEEERTAWALVFSRNGPQCEGFHASPRREAARGLSLRAEGSPAGCKGWNTTSTVESKNPKALQPRSGVRSLLGESYGGGLEDVFPSQRGARIPGA